MTGTSKECTSHAWTDNRGVDASRIEKHLDRTIVQMFQDGVRAGETPAMSPRPAFDPKKHIDEVIVRESAVIDVMRKTGHWKPKS